MKKQRNNPKRHCNYQISNTTLDIRHKNKITDFDESPIKLMKFKEDKHNMSNRLEHLESISKSLIKDCEIKEIIFLKEDVKKICFQIKELEFNRQEIEYFTNTSDILYNYYELIENNSDENTNMMSKMSLKSIAQYFTSATDNTASNLTNDNDVNSNNNRSKFNRALLLDSYLSKTDINYINNNITQDDGNICVHCGKSMKDVLANEGIICCRNCYTIEHIITDNEKPSYKDPPKEISYFSYKRINHFSEWLNQIQGKETTDIPEEVFDKIMLELNKQRIYNLVNVTTTKIREILKKHKINKYYEHIPYILNKITGIPNPHLNSELEDKLKNMFKEIQVPFLKFSPNNRKNFLSYSYVLHKFIQLLDESEFLQYFPLLKSRDKLHQQEQIWKKICEELNWKFIRSI